MKSHFVSGEENLFGKESSVYHNNIQFKFTQNSI